MQAREGHVSMTRGVCVGSTCSEETRKCLRGIDQPQETTTDKDRPWQKAWFKEEVMEESSKDLVSTSKSTVESYMESFAVWQANERANMWSGASGLKTVGKYCTLDAKQAPDCKGSDHWWF